ncbi:ribonuclease toxin immunity protein CdiI [Paenibacillus sp. GCM10028914]|uniref:ribonuclease toxin immunity protein CdiI n=1 Tax=Paenibacillus sp. GCM10028914 TaxID=3273416 RepID=UPI00361677EE
MNENIQVKDTERKEWIIHQLFLSMGFFDTNTREPFRMLSEFQYESGDNICGSEVIGCALSAYYTTDDEYYIGENNVSISYDITNEEVIMKESEFYPYIEKYSMEYVTRNPDQKEEVMECLKNIRKRFKLE